MPKAVQYISQWFLRQTDKLAALGFDTAISCITRPPRDANEHFCLELSFSDVRKCEVDFACMSSFQQDKTVLSVVAAAAAAEYE